MCNGAAANDIAAAGAGVAKDIRIPVANRTPVNTQVDTTSIQPLTQPVVQQAVGQSSFQKVSDELAKFIQMLQDTNVQIS